MQIAPYITGDKNTQRMSIMIILNWAYKISIAYQQMNKFIHVSSGQNKCYRVEHIKKPDYKQSIQAITYY